MYNEGKSSTSNLGYGIHSNGCGRDGSGDGRDSRKPIPVQMALLLYIPSFETPGYLTGFILGAAGLPFLESKPFIFPPTIKNIPKKPLNKILGLNYIHTPKQVHTN